MAGGITTPALVISVSKAGGLGSFGAAYMRPEDLKSAIKIVRAATANPFQVNLFVPDPFAAYDADRYRQAHDRLQAIYEAQGVGFQPRVQAANDFAEQIQVLIEERVPIVSFTFGIPAPDVLSAVRATGTIVIGTATCVAEAKALAAASFDVIVVQGFEAGGHRATFHSTIHSSSETPDVGLFALLPQVVAQAPVPVVASGGIMTGEGIVAALALGASGCQLGTAFMGCPEAGLTTSWRAALAQSADTGTTLTRVFSGRAARGIRNRFIEQMESVRNDVPPFPIQNALTAPLRADAKKRDDPDYQSLWAGQAARMTRDIPAADLVNALVVEAEAAQRTLCEIPFRKPSSSGDQGSCKDEA